MAETVQTVQPISAGEALVQAAILTAPNGMRYGTYGILDSDGITVSPSLARLAGTIPAVMAPGLAKTVFYFVPLVIASERSGSTAPVSVAPVWTIDLADSAVCHRNAHLADHDAVMHLDRLQNDPFALAFELFLNVAHTFVDATGVPAVFTDLLATQHAAGTRGETSHDAWDYRQKINANTSDEKSRTNYFETAYVDSLAIYLLSMYLDFDYADLREREYPLLAPAALAERLRCIHKLFPPNSGYTFEIRYRRR